MRLYRSKPGLAKKTRWSIKKGVFMKKYVLTFLSLMFLSNFAFADGGIPLWGLTTSTLLGSTGFLSIAYLPLIVPYMAVLIVLFLMVVFIEVAVIGFILKPVNYEKIFDITFKVNLVSTLAGAILLFIPVPFTQCPLTGLQCGLLGPWAFWGYLSLIIYNIICFYISYLIEYGIAKKLLSDIKPPKLRKAFLWANIATYALPILLYTIALVSAIKTGDLF